MTQFLSLFAGHGLKFAAVFGMLAMLGTWDWKRIRQAENRGAESVRVEAERKSNDNARKADNARRTADQLPPGRLRDKHCRDC
jgi:hypothetical protein